MKTQLIFLFLLSISFFLACDREKTTIAQGNDLTMLQDGNPFNFSPENVDGHILIVSNHLTGSEQPSDFSITGNLKNKKGKPFNWSELSLAGIPLTVETTPDGEIRPGRVAQYFSILRPTEGYDDIYNAYQKGKIDFNLNSVQETIEIPNLIELDLSANIFYSDDIGRFDGVNLKKNFIIRWNPNSDLAKDGLSKVGMFAVYHAGTSRRYIDENLPENNKTIFKLVDDAVGEVVISPSEFAQKEFPDSGLITITIARSSAQLLDTLEDLELVISGVTYQASDYIQLSY